jgi:pimeloyl-ACP methyl ester carboxylesterase
MEPIIPVSGCWTPELRFGNVSVFSTANFMFARLKDASPDVTSPITLRNWGFADLKLLQNQVWQDICERTKSHQRVRLVGHSVGGLIAASLLTLHPEKITQAHAVASPMGGGLQSMAEYFRPNTALIEWWSGGSMRRFDKSVDPFAEKTIGLYLDNAAELAGRLVLIGSEFDEIVPILSALEPQYAGAKRYTIPLENEVRHMDTIRDNVVARIVTAPSGAHGVAA